MEVTDFNSAPVTEQESKVKLRLYQEEMLDASLKRNVIVAMDTGSGKTHVAIYRILAELETSGTSKLVWFMCPSVALAMQQYKILSTHLPGYLVKTLTGLDGVDKWTDQRLWDAVLTNVRVVVGTPAVLSDALTHGFIHMSRLALLVFDEAHRCIKDSPMNLIMKNFYHPTKSRGEHAPSILGLTASPVMSAKAGTLETIEANLDAVAITPKRHRSELKQYVHPPEVSSVVYDSAIVEPHVALPQIYRRMKEAVESYDLGKDPYVIDLHRQGDERSQRRLAALKDDPKTFCLRQLKGMSNRSVALLEQLGLSAAEWYIKTCISRFKQRRLVENLILPSLTEKERSHLDSIFSEITTEETVPGISSINISSPVTPKVSSLKQVLLSNASQSVRAIIFVEQRVIVAGLAHLLQSCSDITSRYSLGTHVGSSSSAFHKASVADLAEMKEQDQDLVDFRSGNKNLMIATNVLEEGIDVTACNLVICFDPPSNLVSFVQRRGRARQKGSKYVVFIPQDDSRATASKWQRLEAEMKEAYMNELRASYPQLQPEPEDEDALRSRRYHISSTGALLTLENAKAHLYHFCAVSTSLASKYIDLRPEFDVTNNGGRKPYTTRVTLPSFVHPDLRTACSSLFWISEATAIKDAAFQAYVALHKAGLVNNNLLPLTKDYGPDEGQLHVDQPSIVEVSERINTWALLYHISEYADASFNPARLVLRLDRKELADIVIWLPAQLSRPPTTKIYWNENITYMMTIDPGHDFAPSREPDHLQSRNFTQTLLWSVHGNRMLQDRNDFPVLFSPDVYCFKDKQNGWEGSLPAATLISGDKTDVEYGLIRVKGQVGKAYIYRDIISKYSIFGSVTQPELIATAFPKRKDFLHPVARRDAMGPAYEAKHSLSIDECTVDRLPAKHAMMAAFIPSIMHRLDITYLAEYLSCGLLRDVQIADMSLIVEALSAPSALEEVDYNRLEFLGDSVLKFCAVLQVMARHLNWPEGYLSLEKYRIVSNNTLAKTALRVELDRFISTKPFTGNKWRPVYVNDLPKTLDNGKREMSSKTLADVVEALIGAAYVDGGLEKAFTCIRTFLPDESWINHPEANETLLAELPASKQSNIALLEQLIGHDFTNPSLLIEAITHASFPQNRIGQSYERLEFLGDAVLDLITVPKLFAHPRRLKHWELHRVREAFVSGNYLGYCCMSYAIDEEKYNVVENGAKKMKVEESTRQVHLHDFIRAGGNLLQDKRRSLEAFEKLRGVVDDALESGQEYPWPDLIAMRPQKFFSDLIESVLGALYLDTHGDLSVCEAFVEKLGILKHMRRILDENVETAFPKERVGNLADREGVEYHVTKLDVGDGAKTFGCSVEVGGEVVVSVDGCGSKEEAEARAAWKAIKVLKAKVGADEDGGVNISMKDGDGMERGDSGFGNGMEHTSDDEQSLGS